MENILTYASQALLIIAVICTFISVVTEFTKDIGFLREIPTSLQVLVLSFLTCTLLLIAYLSYKGIEFVWYYILAIIFASFLIAIICCRGWDFLIDIWKRFYRSQDNLK